MRGAVGRYVAALLSGAVFGVGLAMSDMISRDRILGFLDVAGRWDPTLAYVMSGALAVTLIAFRCVLRMPRPVMEPAFCLPTARTIDRPLLLGAALFGIGWGVSGYCPGPGVAIVPLGPVPALVYLAGLVIGSLAYRKMSSASRSACSNPAQQPHTLPGSTKSSA